MEKTVKYIMGAIVFILGLCFILWNWNIGVGGPQLIIIIAMFFILGVFLLIVKLFFPKGKLGKKGSKARLAAFKACVAYWLEFTEGQQRISYSGTNCMPKVFTSSGMKLNVQMFDASINNDARERVILFYCVEEQDVIGHIHNPTRAQRDELFDKFEPFGHHATLRDFRHTGVNINVGRDGKPKDKDKLVESEDNDDDSRK